MESRSGISQMGIGGQSAAPTQTLNISRSNITHSLRREIRPEEQAQYRHILKQFDPQMRQEYSVKDLGTIIRILGHNPSEKQIEEMIQIVDRMGTGIFREDDLFELLLYYQFEDPEEEEVCDALKIFDYDDDELIEVPEISETLIENGEGIDALRLEQILKELDPKQKNRFSIEKFRKIIFGN